MAEIIEHLEWLVSYEQSSGRADSSRDFIVDTFYYSTINPEKAVVMEALLRFGRRFPEQMAWVSGTFGRWRRQTGNTRPSE